MDITFDDLIPKKNKQIDFSDLIPPQPQGPPVLAPPPIARPDQIVFRGSILPFSKTDRNEVRFDPNSGLIGALIDAVKLPNDVLRGRVDPLSDEGIERAVGATAILSPSNPAVNSGARMFGAGQAVIKPKARVPTTAELGAAAKSQYKAIDNSDLKLRPDVLGEFATRASTDLYKKGFRPRTAPNTFGELDDINKNLASGIAREDGAFVDGPSLQALQRGIKMGGAPSANFPGDNRAAAITSDVLDDVLTSVQQKDLISGRADEFVSTLKEANANHAAFKRSDTVDKLSQDADIRAASANSGQNASNRLRQGIASLITSPRKSRGFSTEEMKALERAVHGSKTANTARFAANVLGKGGGLGTLGAGTAFGVLGSSVGGPVGGAIAGGIGFGLGRFANAIDRRSTRKAFNAASEEVRKRSPLFQQRQAALPKPFKDQREVYAKNLYRQLFTDYLNSNENAAQHPVQLITGPPARAVKRFFNR